MKAVSNKILGSTVHATSRIDAASEGGFGVPPPPRKILKIILHLVVSGSMENDFNAKINNTLHKLDIVILNIIEENKGWNPSSLCKQFNLISKLETQIMEVQRGGVWYQSGRGP